ncbi:replication initiator protein [Dipodfec virus UOA04_Rod_623]|nr:replication initiator protein [Dipodfec virus UOA04_Rod_623]
MCLTPRVSISPSFYYYARKHGSVVIYGELIRVVDCHCCVNTAPIYEFLSSRFPDKFVYSTTKTRLGNRVRRYLVLGDDTFQDLCDNSFFYDDFQRVPVSRPIFCQFNCGKCYECLLQRRTNLVSTVTLGFCGLTCPAVKLLITYDDDNLPSDGVSKRDCQLFFKRLRYYLSRAGFNSSFKYFLCAEYGHSRRRPHYHAVLYDILDQPCGSDYYVYKLICHFINISWNKGFVTINQAKDSGCASYFTKYMTKAEDNVPTGSNSLFYLKSVGLTRRYFERYASFHRSNPTCLDCKFTYMNDVVTASIPTSLSMRLFPPVYNILGAKTSSVFRHMYLYTHFMNRFITDGHLNEFLPPRFDMLEHDELYFRYCPSEYEMNKLYYEHMKEHSHMSYKSLYTLYSSRFSRLVAFAIKYLSKHPPLSLSPELYAAREAHVSAKVAFFKRNFATMREKNIRHLNMVNSLIFRSTDCQ